MKTIQITVSVGGVSPSHNQVSRNIAANESTDWTSIVESMLETLEGADKGNF